MINIRPNREVFLRETGKLIFHGAGLCFSELFKEVLLALTAGLSLISETYKYFFFVTLKTKARTLQQSSY